MISTPELKQGRFGEQAAEGDRGATRRRLSARRISPRCGRIDAEKLVETLRGPAISRSARSMAGFCLASWSKSSIVASRRRCRSSQASTAARSARCGSSRRRCRPMRRRMRHRSAAICRPRRQVSEALSRPALEESILAATRDALYGWTAERLVAKQTALGQPAFLYIFDHGYPAADAAGLHAFHAAELPYVFGTAERTPPLWPKVPATAAEAALSDAMLGYWTSFARSARPSAANQPQWRPTVRRVHTWPSPTRRGRRRISYRACMN